jgi:hypothetical protein
MVVFFGIVIIYERNSPLKIGNFFSFGISGGVYYTMRLKFLKKKLFLKTLFEKTGPGMSEMNKIPSLFQHFPELEQNLPWKPLGQFPTPIRKLDGLGYDFSEVSQSLYMFEPCGFVTSPI